MSELRLLNEAVERVGGPLEWRESQAYTQRERPALPWTDAVTDVQDGPIPDAVCEQTRQRFSDVELVNLTLAIATINAWNRMAVAFAMQWKPTRGVVE